MNTRDSERPQAVPESTALLQKAMNDHESSECDTASDDGLYDDNCCATHRCYTVEYTCAPWQALGEVAAEAMCGDADNSMLPRSERVMGAIITPIIAPFALLASTVGFFIGAGRDTVNGVGHACEQRCINRREP